MADGILRRMTTRRVGQHGVAVQVNVIQNAAAFFVDEQRQQMSSIGEDHAACLGVEHRVHHGHKLSRGEVIDQQLVQPGQNLTRRTAGFSQGAEDTAGSDSPGLVWRIDQFRERRRLVILGWAGGSRAPDVSRPDG